MLAAFVGGGRPFVVLQNTHTRGCTGNKRGVLGAVFTRLPPTPTTHSTNHADARASRHRNVQGPLHHRRERLLRRLDRVRRLSQVRLRQQRRRPGFRRPRRRRHEGTSVSHPTHPRGRWLRSGPPECSVLPCWLLSCLYCCNDTCCAPDESHSLDRRAASARPSAVRELRRPYPARESEAARSLFAVKFRLLENSLRKHVCEPLIIREFAGATTETRRHNPAKGVQVDLTCGVCASCRVGREVCHEEIVLCRVWSAF